MRTDSRYEILDKHECQVKVGPGWVDSIKKNASRTLSHSNVWGYGQNYPIPKEGTKKICAARIKFSGKIEPVLARVANKNGWKFTHPCDVFAINTSPNTFPLDFVVLETIGFQFGEHRIYCLITPKEKKAGYSYESMIRRGIYWFAFLC
jgi:hypothetical protein